MVKCRILMEENYANLSDPDPQHCLSVKSRAQQKGGDGGFRARNQGEHLKYEKSTEKDCFLLPAQGEWCCSSIDRNTHIFYIHWHALINDCSKKVEHKARYQYLIEVGVYCQSQGKSNHEFQKIVKPEKFREINFRQILSYFCLSVFSLFPAETVNRNFSAT